MQILLNQAEVSQIALEYVQTTMGLDGINNDFRVDCNDDGTITVIINEEAGDQPERDTQPAGERPAKKPRRTKAQIEADNKAEAERLAAAQAEAASGNDAVSTAKPDAETPAVAVEGAGETTQEQSAPGEPDAEQEVAEDPAVEDPVAEPEPEVNPSPVVDTPVDVDEPVATEEAAVKPAGVSLFANLRRPNNAAS